MKLDFRDGSEDFTEIQKEYAAYLLSGATLNEVEINAKFGDQINQLRNNLDIRRYVADQKILRQNKKALLDQMHIDKIVKLIPMAVKVLVHGMNPNSTNKLTPDQKWAAGLVLKPGLAQLEKMSINAADLEFEFDDNGNAIRIDKQDEAL